MKSNEPLREFFSTSSSIVLSFALVLGVASTFAATSKWGAYAPFAFVVVGPFEFHNYDVALYPLFTLTVLRKIWGKVGSVGALCLVWGINELTFNSVYILANQAQISIWETHANQIYLALMVVFVVVGLKVTRPRISTNWLSLVFPIFLVVWIGAGAPLIVEIARPLILTNWPWEVAYQFALFTSFLATFRRRDQVA